MNVNIREFYDSLTLEDLIYFSRRGYRPILNDGYITGWEVERRENK